jgi:hypothetical protein
MILRANVAIRGYFSNMALSRLRSLNENLTTRKGEAILSQAMILSLLPNDFLKRDSELNDYAIEGNVYLRNGKLVCLIFPIDLVLHKHIRISKWRLAKEHS